MSVLLPLLRSINLVFGAVLFGSMIMEYMLLIPLIRGLPAGAGLQVLRTISPIAIRYVPRCAQISFTSALAILLGWRHLAPPAAIVTLIGLLFSIGGIVVTYRWYFPSEWKLLSWPPEAVPPEGPEVMRRWSLQHTVRMLLYGTGFILFVVATAFWP